MAKLPRRPRRRKFLWTLWCRRKTPVCLMISLKVCRRRRAAASINTLCSMQGLGYLDHASLQTRTHTHPHSQTDTRTHNQTVKQSHTHRHTHRNTHTQRNTNPETHSHTHTPLPIQWHGPIGRAVVLLLQRYFIFDTVPATFSPSELVTFWWVTWEGEGSNKKMTRCDMGGGRVKKPIFRVTYLLHGPQGQSIHQGATRT